MVCRVFTMAVVLLASAGPAAAGAPTDRLRSFFDHVNQIIVAPEAEGGLDERLAAVRGLVNEIVDFDGAAALALGRHWEGLAPADRVAFTRLYADIVERAYLSWIGGKARLGEEGVSVRWLEETLDDATATVSSALLARTGGELDIDYRLVRRGQAWLVRDVLVDGVSLAGNYRVQFDRVLQQGSYADLVARMQEKVGAAARLAASVHGAGAPPTAVVVAAIRNEPGAVVSDVRPSAMTQPPAAPSSGTQVQPTAPAPMLAPMTSTPPTAAPPTSGPTRAGLPTPSGPTHAAAVSAAAMPAVPLRRPAAPRELWVQVGVFRTVDAAARMMQQLRRYAVTLTFGGQREAPRARLLVGPFADRAAAVSTMRALHASGLAAFITDTSD
jgi:phospholipid transport system substrate-binding protein